MKVSTILAYPSVPLIMNPYILGSTAWVMYYGR